MNMLRTAASLKRGWVPASLLITRLRNATPQSPLAAALGEYGRIVRTNFVLGDCADPVQRARIAGQLNKGESINLTRRTAIGLGGPELSRGLVTDLRAIDTLFVEIGDPIVEPPAVQLLPLAVFV